MKPSNHHIHGKSDDISAASPRIPSNELNCRLVLDVYLCIVEIKKIAGSYKNGNIIDKFQSKREG